MKNKILINLIVVSGLSVDLFGLVPATQSTVQAATVIRVTTSGTPNYPCGDTWSNACELQTALLNAVFGDEIWVAAGIYKPGINRTDTFQLVNGVAVYGGFVGMETDNNQRDWETNLTLLSGDIGTEADSSDNSYHVVSGVIIGPSTKLDGFTITGGNSDSEYPNNRGGGMLNYYYSSPTLVNLIFIGNQADFGGGMYITVSSPSLTNLTFSGNSVEGFGGGMFNEGSNPILTNVTFSGNSGSEGGGMYNAHSNPILTNVTFSGNSAFAGGGIRNDGASSPNLTNTILWGNTAGVGSQIANSGLSSFIQYCDVQGGCATNSGNDCSGGGNIDTDPLFVRNPNPGSDGTWGTDDDDYGDLRLQNGSPAIDAGNNSAPGLAGITTDLDGNPRFVDIPGVEDTGLGTPPLIDMGAYENQDTNFKGDTTTTILSDVPDPSKVGEPITVAFEVTTDFSTPSGEVTVTVEGEAESCTDTLAFGLGDCEIALGNTGTYTITATYGGDDYFNTSSSATEQHTVVKGDTTTTILSDVPDPSKVGEPITVTFEVTAEYGIPSGYVTVAVAGETESCTDTLASGFGDCEIALNNTGTYTLNAVYSGGDLFNSSSSASEQHMVIKGDTTTTILLDNPDPSQVGEPFDVVFEVMSASGTPSGLVTVTVAGQTESCTDTLVGGAGECQIALNSPGMYTLIATYNGDDQYLSSSDEESHSVIPVSIYIPCVFQDYCPDFFDDFTNSSSGWEIGENKFVRYEYLNGEYQIFSKSDEYFYMFSAPTCARESYSVEVDARWAGTPGESYGILFGMIGDYEQYYGFNINTDYQDFGLWRWDGNVWQPIVPITISYAIHNGSATNHLRVIRDGVQITLEVNGVILGTWTDGNITGKTRVGILSAPYYDESNSDARFDNFRVTSWNVNPMTLDIP